MAEKIAATTTPLGHGWPVPTAKQAMPMIAVAQ